jgi:uncharacterized protein with PIN domain
MKKKKPGKTECPECSAPNVIFTGFGQRDTVNAEEKLSGNIRWQFQCKDCRSFFWSETRMHQVPQP